MCAGQDRTGVEGQCRSRSNSGICLVGTPLGVVKGVNSICWAPVAFSICTRYVHLQDIALDEGRGNGCGSIEARGHISVWIPGAADAE